MINPNDNTNTQTSPTWDEVLKDLQEQCGFRVEHMPASESDAGGLYLHHPLLGLRYTIKEPESGAAVPATGVNELLDISDAYHASVEEQNALVTAWDEAGWHAHMEKRRYDDEIHSAHDDDTRRKYEELDRQGICRFIYEGSDPRAKGARFSLPTHCEYAYDIFDTELAKKQMAAMLSPHTTVGGVEHQGSGAPAKLPFVDRQEVAEQPPEQPRR